jgi:hypothetical protein
LVDLTALGREELSFTDDRTVRIHVVRQVGASTDEDSPFNRCHR